MDVKELYLKLLQRYGIDPASTHVMGALRDLVSDADLRAMIEGVAEEILHRTRDPIGTGMAVACAALCYRAGYDTGYEEGTGGIPKDGTKIVLPTSGVEMP